MDWERITAMLAAGRVVTAREVDDRPTPDSGLAIERRGDAHPARIFTGERLRSLARLFRRHRGGTSGSD